MGTWGPGLYQNDTSEDVKAYYVDQLHRGKTSEQITKELLEQYQEELLDLQEQVDFWCALADAQWERGRLLPYVKEQAISCITGEDALADWRHASHKLATKRKQVLEKLLDKLNTPQPAEKKISQYKLYHCPWKVGDVYALPLDGVTDLPPELEDKMLLMEIVDFGVWHPGHTIPVAYLKIIEKHQLALNSETYNEISYLKVDRYHVDADFLRALKNKTGGSTEIDDVLNSVDEQDMVTEYRIKIITISTRVIPKNLQFVGTFTGIIHPPKEYIPAIKHNVSSTDWKSLVSKAVALFARQ